MIPKQRILLMEHLDLREVHIGKHLCWISDRISTRRHPLIALGWPSSCRISIFKLHILENSLRIVEPTTHVNVGISVLLPMFLIHIFDKFNLHFLFNSIKTHRLVSSITQLLGLCFDVNVLFFYSFFEAFHVRFDVVNVLNPLLRRRTSYISKDLLYLKILHLQLINLMNQSNIFSFKLTEVLRLFYVFEYFSKFVDEFIYALVESFFYFH